MRAFSRSKLDEMAKAALGANEPIPQWRDGSKSKLDNVKDKQYKNLQ
ncbi:MAG: hypothetical protein P8I81_17715 [Pseudomonadales bacterium]|nr:hypothetical protein [Pseudomonadales bacterium]